MTKATKDQKIERVNNILFPLLSQIIYHDRPVYCNRTETREIAEIIVETVEADSFEETKEKWLKTFAS